MARAAAAAYKLKRIYFVPADIQPLKAATKVTPYYHRFAMLALATEGEKTFVPSLLEAPEIIRTEGKPASYSIDTVRRLRARLPKSDRLFFLIGIDAFLSIRKWKNSVELLRECEFIVASRPGYSLADVAGALPSELRSQEEMPSVLIKKEAQGEIALGGAVIHLLPGVEAPVSATKIRDMARVGRSIERLVGPEVAEYICKLKLYTNDEEAGLPPLPEAQVSASGMKVISVGKTAARKLTKR